jgi:hypothetical protein
LYEATDDIQPIGDSGDACVVNRYGQRRSQSPTILRGIVFLDRGSADYTGSIEETIQKHLEPSRFLKSPDEIDFFSDGRGRDLCSLY